MKKLIFLFIAAFIVITSHAQQYSDYEDVIYLKNGSIYRGIIIEQIPNEKLKIQSKDRNVFAVNFSEVEKITKEEIPNSFYRGRHYENKIIDKPNFEDDKPRRERKPTKLAGFYMNWGLGFAGADLNQGFGIEMNLGGKIFRQKVKESTKKAVVGVDVFGFLGGTFGSGVGGQFGVNVGPTIAWKLRDGKRGIIFLTPYSGINISSGWVDVPGYYNYDPYYSYYYNDYYSVRYTTVTIPAGIKFEYQYRKFICGMNTNLGFGISRQDGQFQGLGVSGRAMLFVGVKF